VGGIVIRVVRWQKILGDWGGVGMTIGAVIYPRHSVVHTKTGTRAEGGAGEKSILRTTVATHATDRVEAGATRRAVDQHGKPATGAVAGIAIAIQHDVAMDVVKIVSP